MDISCPFCVCPASPYGSGSSQVIACSRKHFGQMYLPCIGHMALRCMVLHQISDSRSIVITLPPTVRIPDLCAPHSLNQQFGRQKKTVAFLSLDHGLIRPAAFGIRVKGCLRRGVTARFRDGISLACLLLSRGCGERDAPSSNVPIPGFTFPSLVATAYDMRPRAHAKVCRVTARRHHS
jgi:hypothetical protein